MSSVPSSAPAAAARSRPLTYPPMLPPAGGRITVPVGRSSQASRIAGHPVRDGRIPAGGSHRPLYPSPAPLTERPALAVHRVDLAGHPHRLPATGTDRHHRGLALDALKAWGRDTADLENAADIAARERYAQPRAEPHALPAGATRRAAAATARTELSRRGDQNGRLDGVPDAGLGAGPAEGGGSARSTPAAAAAAAQSATGSSSARFSGTRWVSGPITAGPASMPR